MRPGDLPYKFRDIKTYGSTEWLANNEKKYRSVFDETVSTYIYCEVSLYNKLFDEEDWELKMQLRCLDGAGNIICDLNCDRKVAMADNIVYIREGWGVKTSGTYWRKGVYRWEVWVDDKFISSKNFYINSAGVSSIKEGNPYFKINTIKLYEGPDTNVKFEDRKYFKAFNMHDTRYVWSEFNAQNLQKGSDAWACELIFNFKNHTGHLKGSVTKLFMVNRDDDFLMTTTGWGAEKKGTWSKDNYYVEIIFMDELVAVVPFEVADDYTLAVEEDFTPTIMEQIGKVKQEESETEGETKDNKPQKLEKKLPPKVEEESLEEVMKELDDLIGLETIKTKIKEYSSYLNFINIRQQKGIGDDDKINLHAVFKGNPGTGKTTVARMLGKIYKQLGLLSKGHVHEVDRSDLVAEYIGQTAPKTKEAIKKAKGGILFVDEAYSLARKDDDAKDFGKEAVEILLKELSDGDDIAIIVAGYPSEMEIFLNSNPGLKSRFTMHYDFPDYIPQSLIRIADYAAVKKQVSLSNDARDFLLKKLTDAYRTRTKFFGNARLVNSLIDECKLNLGLRIMQSPNPEELTNEELSTIEVSDVSKVFEEDGITKVDIPIDEELLKESLAKLKGLIGLEKVKHDIDELVKLVRFYKETGKDLKKNFSLHSVFTGNPGTGKTTVARILAQIYKALGVLERGNLVECDRQQLVGGYIGQTAIKTAEVIDKAMGGVLFIDEAYSLTEGGNSDYGKEAIEIILKRMEDMRGEFVVIAAGYTQNMENFLESNPGLKSRFDRVFEFEDFKPDELYEIAHNQLIDFKITPDEAAEKHLKAYLEMMYGIKDKYFGNGREVRKVIEQAVRNQHLRLSQMTVKERTPEAINKLTFEDVKEFSLDAPNRKPGIGFRMDG